MTDQDSSSEQKDQATGSRREPSFKRHGSRYRARRRAVDFLFEAEQRGIDAVELLEERLEMVVDPELDIKPIAEYTEAIVRGVAAEIVGIDATIAEYLSDEWPLRRIPAVDRAILRLSTWELFHNSEIPPRVAVVEGVELASEYSTDVAPPYINAVLDAEAEVADQARLAAAAVSVSITAEPCESSSFAQIAQEQLADDAARDVLANGDTEEFKVVEEPAVSDDAAQVADKESNNTPASE
ncbi:transcription antitermination factor NusB [Corynebacterium lactis]|uniref:Transcription antitermination protein NusB n=1 Tax=Corynebacterium lactis RW2-5 TaxID=1408189 RepID=A0A0K2H0W7_9CORY|nr:nitrogen utilization protein B [Corynebacterium lactis RW2-5]